MPALALWKGVNVKTNDYKFTDRVVGEYFRISSSEMWIHKYLGPVKAPATGDATQPGGDGINVISPTAPELGIQDVLNMENRDRIYDPNIYSLKGHYSLTDTEFNLSQFGLFLNNDTIFITFHMNDMVNSISRTLMSGDVIELVHRRDDQILGVDYSISKYYVVEEGARPADGWSPTWWNHLWRVKCIPITDSQEYKGILGLPATDVNGDPLITGNGNTMTLGDLLSTYNTDIAISDAISTQAANEVPFRNLQAAQFYIFPNDFNNEISIFISDNIPPNGSNPVPSGTTFPSNPQIGDWFIRTDYMPAILFRRVKGNVTGNDIWIRKEVNWRTSWTPANSLLSKFINNQDTQTTLQDGSIISEQQDLRQVLKAKLDPNII